VFEFKASGGGLGSQDTVGAGGRYDGLIGQFGGGEVPGVGFGCGIERLLLALDSDAATAPSADVFVGADPDAGFGAQQGAAWLADALRRVRSAESPRGLTVELDLMGRSAKRQAKACDCPVRVLVGATGVHMFTRGGSWEGQLITDQSLAPTIIAKAVPSTNTPD
jgi:histidyl-tRNA synthetase